MSGFKINLGAEVRDRVTGFKGIVVARTEWHFGCRRYVVQPPGLTKEGKTFETGNFDEDALEVLKDFKKPTVNKTGGPQPRVTRGQEMKR